MNRVADLLRAMLDAEQRAEDEDTVEAWDALDRARAAWQAAAREEAQQ